MRYSIKLLVISLFAFTTLFSCGEKQEKSSNKINEEVAEITSSDSTEISSKRSLDESIYGIWVLKKKKGWLEFFEDGTFSKGNGTEVKSEKKKYKIDEAHSSLFIETNKGNREFYFRFENGFLLIKAKGKEREFKYRRSDKRPE